MKRAITILCCLICSNATFAQEKYLQRVETVNNVAAGLNILVGYLLDKAVAAEIEKDFKDTFEKLISDELDESNIERGCLLDVVLFERDIDIPGPTYKILFVGCAATVCEARSRPGIEELVFLKPKAESYSVWYERNKSGQIVSTKMPRRRNIPCDSSE